MTLNEWISSILEDEPRLLTWLVVTPSVVALGLVGLIRAARSNANEGRNGSVVPIDVKHRMERSAGVWLPSPFRLPYITPRPCSFHEILPFPYRPFRAGPQHTTMGLKAMSWDDWIELDSLYVPYQRIREQRIYDRGPHLIQTMPPRDDLMTSAAEAAWELLAELVDYLPKRYPQSFRVLIGNANHVHPRRASMFEGVIEITVVPTARTIRLDDPSLDPMQAAALLVQDDLAIMIEGKDGKYYLQAGAVLVPGFWRLEDKIGMSLDEIHTSGDVPHYREKLQPSMTRFFTKLGVDKPVWRNNYFFQVIDEHEVDDLDPLELGWSESTGGPEDRSKAKRDFPPVIKPSTIVYRSERQTLRRLPRTGAIVFTIRTYVVPLEELAKEPGVAERLASAVRGMSEETWKYKNGSLYGEVLLNCLDEYADKQ